MAAPITHLAVLDRVPATGLDLASELFHRINRVIPQDQKVLSFPPSCSARDAVPLLQHHGYLRWAFGRRLSSVTSSTSARTSDPN